MKCISAVTIGKLIEAHIEHDEEKFMSYANFIADAYEEYGEERSAKIIRNKISGEYKKEPKVTLDEYEENKKNGFLLGILGAAAVNLSNRTYPYTVMTGNDMKAQFISQRVSDFMMDADTRLSLGD